eukprot:scaffold5285_cov137-Isochrysis_galbana.AAC.6
MREAGVGVAHIEISDDGREHRHAQAGEGGVGLNLRGGGAAGADGCAVQRQGGHIDARARGGPDRTHTRQAASAGSRGWVWRIP